MSASGNMIAKGQTETIHAPEIGANECTWGEKIGGGCFGSVFAGGCRGVNVAIKKLTKTDLDPKTLEEFRKEVDIMTQMRHPNVVLFMGACTKDKDMFIVSERMKSSVGHLLQNNEPISMLKRIYMARDTCAGMAWLHGANPQIIHRDLKPHNLLVDDVWNVKVCDFGLSQVKTREEKIRDGKSTPGTPLWMAPEVLTGKDVDEKADVYSFGLVLWEIVTGLELFPEMESYSQFKRAICIENYRPNIPAKNKQGQPIVRSLSDLMKKCWDKDTHVRPSFKECITLLDYIAVDAVVNDPNANAFWKKNFLSYKMVEFSTLTTAFSNLLGLGQPDANDVNQKCLRAMLAIPNPVPNAKDPHVVVLEQFGYVMDWFAPLEINHKGFSILDTMRNLMQQNWFHGDVLRTTAENSLAAKPAGTFLVRTSKTESKLSPFTISKISKQGAVTHQRIHRKENGLFEVIIEYQNQRTSRVSQTPLLGPFIQELKEELHLISPCPGNPYTNLFQETVIQGLSGYNSNDYE